MRLFEISAPISLANRTFRGLGGWSGKPLHPPLTDIPIGAYGLAAILDLISFFGSGTMARDTYVAAGYALQIGLIVSILTAITGLWDWYHLTRSERGTTTWRTANSHLVIMFTATVLVFIDHITRHNGYPNASHTPGGILILTLVMVVLVIVGAAYGGSLVFDHGVRVEAPSTKD